MTSTSSTSVLTGRGRDVGGRASRYPRATTRPTDVDGAQHRGSANRGEEGHVGPVGRRQPGRDRAAGPADQPDAALMGPTTTSSRTNE
jgi:hypothetical protein